MNDEDAAWLVEYARKLERECAALHWALDQTTDLPWQKKARDAGYGVCSDGWVWLIKEGRRFASAGKIAFVDQVRPDQLPGDDYDYVLEHYDFEKLCERLKGARQDGEVSDDRITEG